MFWLKARSEPWLDELPALLVQKVHAVEMRWPSAIVSFRLMYSPSKSHLYHGSVNFTSYALYDDAIWELARRRPSSAGNEILVFDLPRMMNYSTATGHCYCGCDDVRNTTSPCPPLCAARTGWTEDGLHPRTWVQRSYVTLVANAFADALA